jgi:hypothetical protein
VLFLFGSDGRGVYVNDDIDLTTPDIQARLPAGHALGPLVPDLYYLGIGWAFTDPLSDLGPIFPLYELNLATDGVYGPTGSGGANPLASWIPGGPPNFDLGGDYRILLTGAAVALLVPEPGSLALLGIAGLAAIARRRRNRS